jgi:hypothetical protein
MKRMNPKAIIASMFTMSILIKAIMKHRPTATIIASTKKSVNVACIYSPLLLIYRHKGKKDPPLLGNLFVVLFTPLAQLTHSHY